MYEPILSAIGLSDKEVMVFETLLRQGPQTMAELAKHSALKRGDLYNIVANLNDVGVVEIEESSKRKLYRVVHPTRLQTVLEQQSQAIEQTKKTLGVMLPELISAYNVAHSKPGISFYEGKEGVIRAYEELLALNQPIDSIEDKGEMAAFIPEYFPKFIKKRVHKKIFNRVVAPSTNAINITDAKELRETRTIPVAEFPFSMDVKIAGDEVLLTTLEAEQAMAVRLHHPQIASNFKLLFKFFWDHAAKRAPQGAAVVASDGSGSSTVFNN